MGEKLEEAKFKKFSLPLCHHRAEEIVRQTLGLPRNTKLEDDHVRRAALVACLTPLRQSIGSCFATAPAILAQKQRVDLLINDLYDLLTTGRLKRVVEGVEYSVPMSLSSEGLIKVWEYTLASFCDVKREFSHWNLSWSLGLNPEVKGGIGEALYKALEQKLFHCQEKIHEYHLAVLEAFALEDTKARLYHLKSCEDLRSIWEEKAKIVAHFFSFLIREYIRLFQEYFQEVYDPKMAETSLGPYEDRTAGFRLVYTHGRIDPSQWTQIENGDQFIRVLIEFFSNTEPSIAHICETDEAKRLLEEMTTVAIHHVQSRDFLQMALERTSSKDRLPWGYHSGGSVDQIVSIYLGMSLKHEKREIVDELDLFIFLLDTLKSLPPRLTDVFLKDPEQGLLIESPTHIFSLLPGLPFFREGWLDPGFTYTWIRDKFLKSASPVCVFADTNWPNGYFAFVVNPATSNLEIWKTDKEGRFGEPVPLVKTWMGKGKEFSWTIYTTKI